jgi:uridylate kinase
VSSGCGEGARVAVGCGGGALASSATVGRAEQRLSKVERWRRAHEWGEHSRAVVVIGGGTAMRSMSGTRNLVRGNGTQCTSPITNIRHLNNIN